MLQNPKRRRSGNFIDVQICAISMSAAKGHNTAASDQEDLHIDPEQKFTGT